MYRPLADRMRPLTFDDVVGQESILGKNGILRRMLAAGNIPNLIFFGPPGTGKTTVANIIASETNKTLYKLNATTASVADIKQMIADAGTLLAPNGILLYLDEIQYFTKKQQQSLLEFIENGMITLIASTTENPYFYVYTAILSRSTVFEFKPVEESEIERALLRASALLEKDIGSTIRFEDGVLGHLSASAAGDVRKALNSLEVLVLAAQSSGGETVLTLEDAEQVTRRSGLRFDRDGDNHYDLLSAYQKSMRGSDPDAAVYYLARILAGGDLASACRRLLVCAAEDVGLAYPQALQTAVAAVQAADRLGLPEAQIPLAQAVIMVATAPKSNSASEAIAAAAADIAAGKTGDIPAALRDSHYSGAAKRGHGLDYKYPHSFENNWVEQQYLPDELKSAVYYKYGKNKNEQAFKQYWERIRGK